MKKLLLSLIIFIPSFVYSEDITLAECNAMASIINQSTPMNVDEVTVMQSVVCTYPAEIIYNYNLTITARPNDINFNILKNSILNAWCTDPNQIYLLERVSGVQYKYRDINNTYLGELRFTMDEC